MVLPAPDMSSCKKKARCLTGVNEGKAYDPENPCPGYGPFDPVKCDCQTMVGTWRFDGFVSGRGELRPISSGDFNITVEGTKIGLAFGTLAGGSRIELGPRVAEMDNLNATAYQTVLNCTGINGTVGSFWTFGVVTPTGSVNTYSMSCTQPVGLCPIPSCPTDDGGTYTVTGSWTKVA